MATKSTSKETVKQGFYSLYNQPSRTGIAVVENTNVQQYPADPFKVLSATDLLRLRTKRVEYDDDTNNMDQTSIMPETRVDIQQEDIPTPYQQEYTDKQAEVQKEIEEAERKHKEEEERKKQEDK